MRETGGDVGGGACTTELGRASEQRELCEPGRGLGRALQGQWPTPLGPAHVGQGQSGGFLLGQRGSGEGDLLGVMPRHQRDEGARLGQGLGALLTCRSSGLHHTQQLTEFS